MDWLIAALLIGPALWLLQRRSTGLVDYLIWIVVLNREIRRIIDWEQGAFNPLSPLSLVPLAVAGIVAVFALSSVKDVPRRALRLLLLFSCALLGGFIVGLVRNSIAAVYSLAEYLLPLSMMAISAGKSVHEKDFDRWMRTLGYAATFVSAYGIVQYFTIPPWDAFWVRSVAMVGYLGQLLPTQMTLFSTMQERGPCAFFLAWSIVPTLVSKRWRNPLGWPAIILICFAIIVTYVRSAVILILLSVILVPIVCKGKRLLQTLLLGIVCLASVEFLLPRLGFDVARIEDRYSTLSDIQNDASFVERLHIAKSAFASAALNPLGTGLGSAGLGGRMNTGTIEAPMEIGDNGYFEIIFTLGWFGGGAFLFGLATVWSQIKRRERFALSFEIAAAAKLAFLVGAISLYLSNWLVGPESLVFWMLFGRVFAPAREWSRNPADFKCLTDRTAAADLDEHDRVLLPFGGHRANSPN